MKKLIIVCSSILFLNPVYSVTTRMFKVLDTCARYRLNEINAFQATEKLKIEFNKMNELEAKDKVKRYCSVFTPNEKIEF